MRIEILLRVWFVIGCTMFARTAFGQSTSIEGYFEQSTSPSNPTIVGASNCVALAIWDVAVAGGLPGSEYIISAANFTIGLSATVGTGTVNPNNTGITFIQIDISGLGDPSEVAISAIIKWRTGEESSWATAPLVPLRSPVNLSKPKISAPLWACGAATNLQGHQPADRLELFSVTRNLVLGSAPTAFSTSDYLGVRPDSFKDQEKVISRYFTCDGLYTSPDSSVEVVQKFPSLLPAPNIVIASSLTGASVFMVSDVEHGATLHAQR